MKTTRMTPKQEAILPASWQEVNRVIIQYFVLPLWNLRLGHLLKMRALFLGSEARAK